MLRPRAAGSSWRRKNLDWTRSWALALPDFVIGKREWWLCLRGIAARGAGALCFSFSWVCCPAPGLKRLIWGGVGAMLYWLLQSKEQYPEKCLVLFLAAGEARSETW